MSLYSFFERKEDLIDLMVDHVSGEMLLDEIPAGDWRAALRAVLHRQIAVGRQHPWLMSVLGARAAIGPNAARHAEQPLAAIAGPGARAAAGRRHVPVGVRDRGRAGGGRPAARPGLAGVDGRVLRRAHRRWRPAASGRGGPAGSAARRR
ncbi:hypothetical protein Apa02nite_074820 [Actinoplanes palleronii]|uniref:Tetracycline repressor TetR C-terminal domain-containing protein n=1 Tax=Actinoplanes palleronii TaxID=113570 RepID=A0ABQ4BL31_9ACTN|nr:hypothetical protein Apa02nite_074820 [Actinoplanes palleronii]